MGTIAISQSNVCSSSPFEYSLSTESTLKDADVHLACRHIREVDSHTLNCSTESELSPVLVFDHASAECRHVFTTFLPKVASAIRGVVSGRSLALNALPQECFQSLCHFVHGSLQSLQISRKRDTYKARSRKGFARDNRQAIAPNGKGGCYKFCDNNDIHVCKRNKILNVCLKMKHA